MKAEIARRQSNTEKVLALFESRPLEWIPWHEIERHLGGPGWRTRISDARRRGNRIDWNKNVKDSRYMYVPFQPLGPDAATDRSQLSLGGWR